MPKATVTLDEEQIVVALQALREYGHVLERVLRTRRSWDDRLRREQQLNSRLLDQVSTAYAEMDL